MKYYISVYIVIILPFALNEKTSKWQETDSESLSDLNTNVPLGNLVELYPINSDDESKKSKNNYTKENISDVQSDLENISTKQVLSQEKENCWMSLNAKKHFQIMDSLDERYRKVRIDYQNQLGEEFDKQMLETLLKWRGVAQREVFKTTGKTNLIPSGLNLGGYCMMKMKDSVLFFHRIKLRNETHFRINYLHTDVNHMALVMQLSLNDLHLLGAYERSPIDKDPSVLFYAPTFGEVEFLLKNVGYKMEAQLRLTNNKLHIELMTSELKIEDILMMYMNCIDCQKPIRLTEKNIEDFLDRMKTDLDIWLKDYFNDYLTYFGSLKSPSSKFMKAEKYKTIALNEFSDSSLSIIRNRLRKLGADTVKVPHFTIFGENRMQIKLKDGVLLGLDSIYRRSVTTEKKHKDVRKVHLIVGFSSLKVIYKYEASLGVDVPHQNGMIVLSADEITAHMDLSLVKDPETIDLNFGFIQQMKPESLTVEGAASRLIANFKHLLEHHIIAIMSNAIIHNIKMLRTLTRCEPMLLGQNKPNRPLTFDDKIESDDSQKFDDAINVNNNSKSQKPYNINIEDLGSNSQNRDDTSNVENDNPRKLDNITNSDNDTGSQNLESNSDDPQKTDNITNTESDIDSQKPDNNTNIEENGTDL